MWDLLCTFWIPTAIVSFLFLSPTLLGSAFSPYFFLRKTFFRCFSHWIFFILKNIAKQIVPLAQVKPTCPGSCLHLWSRELLTSALWTSIPHPELRLGIVCSLSLSPCWAEGIDTFGNGTRKAQRITWGSCLNVGSVFLQVNRSSSCRGKGRGHHEQQI